MIMLYIYIYIKITWPIPTIKTQPSQLQPLERSLRAPDLNLAVCMVHFYRIWRFPENGGTPNGLVGGIPTPLKNMSQLG